MDHTEKIEKLRRRVAELERRCAALMVDADRREARALEIATNCEKHGEEIRYLRHMTSWFWECMQRESDARSGVVRGLILAQRRIPGEGMVSAADVHKWLTKAIDASRKTLDRPKKLSAVCQGEPECSHNDAFPAAQAEYEGADDRSRP